jgi:nucleoside-diphosphate-sugar epimerase
MQSTSDKPILVTGASGYIASHLIKLLLEKGYKVRGTVRSLADKSKYDFLYNLVPEKKDNLEFFEADLTNKASWQKAVEGCEYIFHVASPFPAGAPKHEDELIIPAVEGTLNVLEAALDKEAKKVVITSSFAAISFGNESKKVLTDDDWSDEVKCPAYPKSKVRAEKAAWEFYEKNKDKIQVTVLNPTGVFGPILTKQPQSTAALLSEFMNGTYPGIPDFKFGVVDVRDLAQAHFNAMFDEKTTGKRYLTSAKLSSIEEICDILKREFGKYGYNIPDKHLTYQEFMDSGHPAAGAHGPFIGRSMSFDNQRSIRELNLNYLSTEQTIIDMAYSLIKYGMIPDKTKA